MAKEMYVGVEGVSRDVKAGYVGVDGVARRFTPDSVNIEFGSFNGNGSGTITVPGLVGASNFIVYGLLDAMHMDSPFIQDFEYLNDGETIIATAFKYNDGKYTNVKVATSYVSFDKTTGTIAITSTFKFKKSTAVYKYVKW